jgi:hypothetical protein
MSVDDSRQRSDTGRSLADCLIGIADGIAAASRTFADEIAQDTRVAALPVTALTAFFSANARLMHEVSAVMRDAADRDGAWRERVSNAQFEDVAATIATHMATTEADKPAAGD